MPATLREPSAWPIMAMTGLIVGLNLGACALLGWKVGGAIPGWYEGKFLAGPLWLGAGLAAVGLLGLVVVAARHLIRFRRNGGTLRLRHWLPFGAAFTACFAMVASFWYPWGIVIVYWVAALRRTGDAL